MTTSDDAQLVSDARTAIYELHLGPLPDEVVKLTHLDGVWPGGCLLQIDGRVDGQPSGGLTVTASFGLSDPGLPAGAGAATGLAGFGYELLVLTQGRQAWPLMFLNWAVPAEILGHGAILDALGADGLASVEGIDLGDGLRSDFLIAPPVPGLPGLPPAEHELPNGSMRFLVATAITGDELRFALEQGRPALMERLVAAGRGQVSALGRDSVLARGSGATVLPFRSRRSGQGAARPEAAAAPLPSAEERAAAQERLRELAEAGDAQAACDLAASLHNGRPDTGGEAEHWFRVAAERGHGWGAFHLGSILLDRGETDQAEFWFGQAKEFGLPI